MALIDEWYTKPRGRGKKGFASMTPERIREIAALGGRRAHEKGTAHRFTPDEAREAGKIGGAIVSRDRDHMSAIGRLARQKKKVANG